VVRVLVSDIVGLLFTFTSPLPVISSASKAKNGKYMWSFELLLVKV